jgi:hypothetical protein
VTTDCPSRVAPQKLASDTPPRFSQRRHASAEDDRTAKVCSKGRVSDGALI